MITHVKAPLFILLLCAVNRACNDLSSKQEKEVTKLITVIVVIIIIVISAAFRGSGKGYGKSSRRAKTYSHPPTVNPPKPEQRTQPKHPRIEKTIPPKSHYEILNLQRGASLDEATEAYRKMASLYHPDKVAHLAPEFQVLAEQRMKEINAAYLEIKSGQGSSSVMDDARQQETHNENNTVVSLDPDVAEMASTATIYRDSDDLYEQALAIVTDMGRASTSVLQRRLGIGYGRAAKILATMESEGFIGPAEGSKPRKVLPAAYEFRERIRRPND